jgi:hypothetical protein
MPENYKILSHLMFLAQQMLLPSSDSISIPRIGPPTSFKNINVKEIIKACDPKTVWRGHYSNYRRAHFGSVVDPEVVLGSLGQVISGNWWPNNVRNY